MNKDRVLTGIRANGDPHIGNYLGAMLPMVEIQKHRGQTHDMFFFVPDLHSFTTPVDHDTLYQHSIRNLKYYVAAGMDFWAPGAYLYRQSYIPAHAELTWILDCFAYMGEMSRMIQFKEKSKSPLSAVEDIEDIFQEYSANILRAENEADRTDNWNLFHERVGRIIKTAEEKIEQHSSVGLFNYPALMAADILLYSARYVPVGEDQRQHLELTRDLGIRINNKFSEVFPDGVFQIVPEDWNKQLQFANRDSGVRIRSLRNPEKKMSKSVDDPAGTIGMLDDPADAAKKIMSATTDSVGAINFDWDRQPGICNLLQILALMSERPVHEVAEQWQGKSSYGELKKATAEKVESFLRDFQTRIAGIDEAKLLQKLEEDEAEVCKIAEATLLRVQQAVGLRPRSL